MAQTLAKVEAAKEEEVADYMREILEAGWGEFTKLLLSIVTGLLA